MNVPHQFTWFGSSQDSLRTLSGPGDIASLRLACHGDSIRLYFWHHRSGSLRSRLFRVRCCKWRVSQRDAAHCEGWLEMLGQPVSPPLWRMAPLMQRDEVIGQWAEYDMTPRTH